MAPIISLPKSLTPEVQHGTTGPLSSVCQDEREEFRESSQEMDKIYKDIKETKNSIIDLKYALKIIKNRTGTVYIFAL